ncbi:hypothetical protein CGRA01v4_10060 [Colletotrichum graminicola]|uniref:Uncharacterized protein n=1 Tax=Colletotrichum graminicola (strain M1.001 / M2 / FGSC 10212) TaxID=645133 RepID=E3QI17_COLGM|nr:uncharacterized protein GLRG_05649 [Colletotrichum graminicola M1.001]EFQ30505.1 hypothetical protein GLRG_05649 [Colletotrichum graminicola M1.001]WDK18774.1 hypothetical protein CGRA01v4_10060 [Colletotrichum graminicola]
MLQRHKAHLRRRLEPRGNFSHLGGISYQRTVSGKLVALAWMVDCSQISCYRSIALFAGLGHKRALPLCISCGRRRVPRPHVQRQLVGGSRHEVPDLASLQLGCHRP